MTETKYPSSPMYEYKFELKKIELRAKLESSRSKITFVEVQSHMLAIGGWENMPGGMWMKNRRISAKCNAYDLENDSWKTLDSLPLADYYISCFYFENKQILYAVSLRNACAVQMMTIDRFFTYKWRMLTLNYEGDYKFSQIVHNFLILVTEVLFFGKQGKCVLFNPETYQLKHIESLKVPNHDTFTLLPQCKRVLNGKLYTLSSEGNLHIMKNGKWICIKGVVN